MCLAAASFLALFSYAPWVRAQHVILVCPPETDPLLYEAFSRLRGELTMHGFEVEVLTAEEGISPDNLALRAESSHAVASVSFVRNQGSTTADIKVNDRVTGTTSIRTIATPAGNETASLLALRAVELLRASLREFGSQSAAPKNSVSASQNATPSVAQSPAAKTAQPPNPPAPTRLPARYRASLRADALAAIQLSDPSSAYGFGAALGVSKGTPFEARLVLAVPWFGAEYSTSRASSRVHLASGSAELAYALPVGPRVQIQPLAALGIARLTTFTSTVLPVTLHPPAPSAWLVMPSIGLGMNVTLSMRWFWNTSARVAMLAPRPILEVDGQRHKLGAPMAVVSSGVGVRF